MHRPSGTTRRALPAVAVTLALTLGSAACSDDAEPADATTTTEATTTETTDAASTTTAPAPEPLADQTPPRGANGIRADDDGRLWVADLDGGQIVAVDAATGAIVVRLGAEAGVTTPDDLAFDAEGRLWWTEFPGGAVGRIDDPEAVDATSAAVAEVGSGANPIAIGPDGQVYVGRTLQGAGLYELAPDEPSSPRTVVADPGVVNAFDVGPDGRIYSPVSDTGEVVAIDPADGAIEVVATGLTLPVSVRWTPDGELAVLSGAPAAVTLVDPATGTTRPFATPATPIGDNMAFGPDGTLYVTGFDQPTVSVIAPDGSVTSLPLGTA